MKRRTFITTLAVGSAGLSVRALGKTSGATFVVAHGAWSAGWAWKKMHPLLTAAGHRLFTPTYTGLGERSHLADPSNSLETHINDVLGVLTYEDLRDVILSVTATAEGRDRCRRPGGRSTFEARLSGRFRSQGRPGAQRPDRS